MAGCVSIAVGFAAPIALAAMAFAAYADAAVPGLPGGVLAVAVVGCVAAAHAVTVRASGVFQIVVTAIKLVLIGILIVAGVWVLHGRLEVLLPNGAAVGLVVTPSFAVALMYVLYSYSGWNAVAYILDEVRDPQRVVPRALVAASVFVMVLYVALNAVFLLAAPTADYVGRLDVAAIAGRRIFGDDGGRLMGGLMALGLVSVISAMTWAGPRVSQAIGRDLAGLGFLGRTSPGGIPRIALGLQTGIVLVMLATGSFEKILLSTQFALLICSFCTVAGVIVLRVRKPELARPFRCPLHPLPPLVFLCFNAFAVVHSAVAHPGQAATGIAAVLAGWVLYFPVQKLSNRP
jgi:APA family basic amino acid/polyamine antiporter